MKYIHSKLNGRMVCCEAKPIFPNSIMYSLAKYANEISIRHKHTKFQIAEAGMPSTYTIMKSIERMVKIKPYQ